MGWRPGAGQGTGDEPVPVPPGASREALVARLCRAQARESQAAAEKLAALRDLIREDDVPWVRITSSTPADCQIDGDYAGTRSEMTFTAVRDALSVVAP